MRKKLILVAAPPACGKNYVSEKIADACKHIVYLDKDDLCDLVGCAFDLCGRERNMDSEFYSQHIRPFEYGTLMRLALSAMRFEDVVLVNAPFGKEVRDVEYMTDLKNKLRKLDAELALIWVSAPMELCYERMKQRNAPRDLWKLQNWDAYVKSINDSLPASLLESGAVDRLIQFNNGDESEFQLSMDSVAQYIMR